jgi:hypothetical protein
MNKTALIAAILSVIVLVVLIFGFNGAPIGYAAAQLQPSVVAEAQVAAESPVITTQEDSSIVTPASAPSAPLETTVGQASFVDVGYAVTDGHLIVEGRTTDKATKNAIADAPIAVYCSGTKIGSTATDAEGAFSALTEGCESGQQVWATVEYQGETYESEHVTFVQFDDSVHHARSRQTVAPSGVPEFSATTLAVAVIAGCLGLAFLRKE